MSERAVHELLSDVSWALAQRLPKRDLYAMLTRLVASAKAGSPEEHFAKLELARLVLDKQPFRAARLLQEVLLGGPDEAAFGLLGIAHMRLGHFRAARRALERALRLAPDDPAVLHNLGHLIDVAFDRPEEALPHLALAHRIVGDEPALASSYAHALARTGQKARAEELLVRGARLSQGLAHATVRAWTASSER
jgi:cytochrome c-type biogenesis protein CcmH/NrfG